MPILYEEITFRPTSRRLQKKASKFIDLTLTDEAGRSVAGTTQSVDTIIWIGSKLYDPVAMVVLTNKPVRVMGRLDTGAWTKLADLKTGGVGQVAYKYRLVSRGVNTFRVEWDGDAEYAGATTTEAKVGVDVAVEGIRADYLIGGALGAVGIILIILALKKRRK